MHTRYTTTVVRLAAAALVAAAVSPLASAQGVTPGKVLFDATKAQMADALTKIDKRLMVELIKFMGNTVLCLKETETST